MPFMVMLVPDAADTDQCLNGGVYWQGSESLQERHTLYLSALNELLESCDDDDDSNNTILSSNQNAQDFIPILAQKLQWSMKEVEVHSYQYYTALAADREPRRKQTTPTDIVPQLQQQGGGVPPQTLAWWTVDEMILFDKLVTKYSPAVNSSLNDHENVTGLSSSSSSLDWLQCVAEQLPSKTLEDVQRRWKLVWEKRPM